MSEQIDVSEQIKLTSTSILEKVRSADNLPSLPTVAVKILQLTNSDNVSAGEIASVIEQDPALTVKVLKVVNSSLFALPRKIASLQQAVVILGLRTVKVMVLTFSLVDAIRERETGEFDYKGYWRRSLTTAVAGRLLAEHSPKCNADEAFVGGLLSDIGMIAAFHAIPELYGEVIRTHDAGDQPIYVVEANLLGASHAAITGDLIKTWGLPETIAAAIAGHHKPIDQPCDTPDATTAALTITLRAAAMIADLFCSKTQTPQLDEAKDKILAALGIGEETLQDLMETLHQHVQEMASMFSLDIGQSRSFQDIQTEAVNQLAKLSMTAELERAELASREENNRQQLEQLSDQNRELVQRAATDGLTGIANRIALDNYLTKTCEETRNLGTTLGFLMLDLDRFKKLNDMFGHQTGDVALQLVGKLLKSLPGDNKFTARYGGEEMAVVVTDASVEDLRAAAEEIRQGIQQIVVPHPERQIRITVSIGAVFVNPNTPNLTPAELISHADKCLYQAKGSGRNRVIFTEMSAAAATQNAPATSHENTPDSRHAAAIT